MKRLSLQTVVEMPEFIKQAEKYMDSISHKAFIDFIAANPLQGNLIQGTGGARKIRWASNAYGGKRGGVRVIYYYYSPDIPIFLFTAYGKNVKDNLTMREKGELKSIIKLLINNYEEYEDE
jgi:mRNA-degrading endonuclease RelE of RelBE toxin-antitoxin system